MLLRILFLSLFLIEVESFKLTKDWEPDCVGDGVNGTCVASHRCLSTNPYIDGLIYPLVCTLTNGDAGVCCTDCELVKNASDAVLDKSDKGFLWKTGEKAWDKCIEYVQKYAYSDCHTKSSVARETTKDKCHVYLPRGKAAVGGTDVYRGELPHMALLGYEDSKQPSEWVCSGSLIADRYILTAAHCIRSQELGPVTEAAFGLLKRSDPPEYWQRYRIKRIIPHPGYKAPSKYHDIALLETEEPVKLSNYSILPACLPAYGGKIPYSPGERFTVQAMATGWGHLGYMKGLADTMQKVALTKFTDEECNELYPPHRHQKTGINSTTQLCFGHKTIIRDTCGGDSGGPLQLDTRHPSCIHTIIGVTSYGKECGFQGGAGVYTRVAVYLPWIESVVWP